MEDPNAAPPQNPSTPTPPTQDANDGWEPVPAQGQSQSQPQPQSAPSAQPSNDGWEPVPTQTQPQQPEQPGMLERLYEGSGLKGAVDLAKQTAQYAVQRPIDIYNQALDATHKGDFKGAAEAWYRLTNMGLEPQNPLVQTATKALMAQVQQAHKQHDTFQKDRAAGHGAVASLVDSATGGAASRAVHDIHSGHAAAVPADVLSGAVDSGAAGPIGSMVSTPVHNLETDARAGNQNGMLGDMLGGATAAGSLLVPGGSEAGVAEGADAAGATAGGDAASSIRPTTTNVAGVDIPTAASNPQLPGGMSRTTKIAKSFATPEGAKDFVTEHVQPAAVQATQANFAQSAVKTADALRDVRGEEPLGANAPKMTDPDDAASMLRGEAKKTYTKLDQAAETDINAWTEKYGKAAQDAEKPSTILGPDGKLASPATPKAEIPPKPKTFTELQDQITDAENKLDPTNTVSQVDRQWAKENLPKFQNERDAFLAKHKDVVSPDELNAADNTWRSSRQYDWIAKKVRTARTDSGAGGATQAEAPTFRTQGLRNMPKNFDNQFGKGSWDNLLGPQGAKNYNDVVNLLATPKTESAIMDALQDLPWGVGKAVKGVRRITGSTALFNKLLFDPEFGQGAIAQFTKRAGQAAGNVVRPAASAAKTGAGVVKTAAQPMVRPAAIAGQAQSQTDATKRRVMSGVQSALAGSQ